MASLLSLVAFVFLPFSDLGMIHRSIWHVTKNTLMSAKAKKIVAFCHVQIIQNLTKNFYASKEIKNANFESKSDIKIFTLVTLQRNNSSMNPQQSRISQG